jgi:hypothetical protein
MSYEAEIGRRNPACMLFLIDQSESMSDPFGGTKSEVRQTNWLMLLTAYFLTCSNDALEAKKERPWTGSR